jgi:hypothetical protein
MPLSQTKSAGNSKIKMAGLAAIVLSKFQIVAKFLFLTFYFSEGDLL